jgi:hypothetical protein
MEEGTLKIEDSHPRRAQLRQIHGAAEGEFPDQRRRRSLFYHHLSPELHEPTHARDVPLELTLAQLLDYQPFSKEGKLIYFKLNIPMPCPPRGTVPVNTRG